MTQVGIIMGSQSDWETMKGAAATNAGAGANSGAKTTFDIEELERQLKAVVDGEYDHLPEAAFYMVGGIEDVKAKAQRLAADAA